MAASTTSRTFCRFQRPTSNVICRPVARSPGSPLACRPPFRPLSDSRSRSMSSRTIFRAKTCRLDRAAAWRIATPFRVVPHTPDVRVDGALVKRFTVGGEGKGRPAAASYAGDGEPGFAGDDEWEKYMQQGADAGLEVRIPIKAGPRLVGVSFLRQMWEPEGLPQPQQRGRVLTNDQIYMGYASVGAVSIAGPYAGPGSAKDTPSRRAIFVCEP